MESRSLVVWISAGILGFQGGTLVLDLIHCSVLSWLYIRRYGLKALDPAVSVVLQPPEGLGRLEDRIGQPSQPQPPASASASALPSEPSAARPRPRAVVPLDPTGVFRDRPRGRVDAAVGQGLSILAGLALGGSVGGGGKADAP